MITEQIRTLLRTMPFKPFTVSQAGGKSLTIEHPDLAMISQSGLTLMVNVEGDRYEWVNIPQVTRVSGISLKAEV